MKISLVKGNGLTGQLNPVNCGGEGCANVISSGVGILPCENVTENDPTPCALDDQGVTRCGGAAWCL